MRETDTAITYYDVLGVTKTATFEDIKAAYRHRASRLHPDRYVASSELQRSDAEDAMSAVNAAWSVLGDEEKRHRYDRQLSVLLEWEAAARGPRNEVGVFEPPQPCEECRAVPTATATVWAVTSYVVVPRIEKQTGTYCHWCGTEIAGEYISHTARKGWWGPLPLIATAVALVLNRLARTQWKSLVPPPRGLDLLALPGSPHEDTMRLAGTKASGAVTPRRRQPAAS